MHDARRPTESALDGWPSHFPLGVQSCLGEGSHEARPRIDELRLPPSRLMPIEVIA